MIPLLRVGILNPLLTIITEFTPFVCIPSFPKSLFQCLTCHHLEQGFWKSSLTLTLATTIISGQIFYLRILPFLGFFFFWVTHCIQECFVDIFVNSFLTRCLHKFLAVIPHSLGLPLPCLWAIPCKELGWTSQFPFSTRHISASCHDLCSAWERCCEFKPGGNPFLLIPFDLNINIPVYDNIFWSDSMGESF